ncbi:histone H1 [Primulina tabacum]|uniref:histone H1 n=1 Tax=Primulina tabacum TaxID=48773 RepID=UPI003F5973D1
MLATAEAPKPKAVKKTPAVKEKKPKAAKTSSHPPYFEMIKEALLALNEKGGSSPYAIAKYMEEKHKSVLPANFRKILGLQLKNSTLKGKLVKIKASFKLSDTGNKNNPKPAAKKPAAVSKKAATTKATAKKPKAAPAAKKATATSVGTKRKAVTKKTEGVKKVAPKKAAAAKPKKPKSIKSPAAKKTKRVKA